MITDGLIKLMKDIHIKEIPENENLKKIANIAEKIINLNEKQKGSGFKIITLKKCLKYYQ